jgi:DNA-binding NarL/FixJ family response regulator
MIRILIADDHCIFRECLARLLRDHADFSLVAEAGSVDEVKSALDKHRVDLVLLDLAMPHDEGLELIPHIKGSNPAAKILVVTMSSDVYICVRALRAGADGFITKSNASIDVVLAIQQIFRGMRYICPTVAEQLAMSYTGGSGNKDAHECLSDREFMVFEMLAAGMRSADIATALSVSEKTVSTHKAHVLQKLDLHSNMDIVRYAIRNGLVTR